MASNLFTEVSSLPGTVLVCNWPSAIVERMNE